MASEFELIERHLADLLPLGENVRRGIGDDCAVVSVPAGRELAVSIDTLNAGVHFPHATDARDVGWKALACGLSDLAAAGADPDWCTLALTLPEGDEAWLAGFAEGFADLARAHGISLAGGDTTGGGTLSVTVQVAGTVPAGAGLSRRGARPGDRVYVSGFPGEAAAGLAALLEGAGGIDPRLIERLNRPVPRVALGRALRGRASACIDLSDGLAADAEHVARASGVAICLDASSLPVSDALAARAGDRAIDHVLGGGDDYELCFTLPAAVTPDPDWTADGTVPLTCVGVVEEGTGVYLRHADGGDRERLSGRGYRHFGNSAS